MLGGNKMRTSTIERNTKETQIKLSINLDGSGKCNITTGIEFFDHMLSQIATHGLIDLDIKAKGDIGVDCHTIPHSDTECKPSSRPRSASCSAAAVFRNVCIIFHEIPKKRLALFLFFRYVESIIQKANAQFSSNS